MRANELTSAIGSSNWKKKRAWLWSTRWVKSDEGLSLKQQATSI